MRTPTIVLLVAAGLAWPASIRAQLEPVCTALDCDASCPVTPSGGTPPATGQTIKHAAGDDGDLEAGAPLSYADNGDGTITDENTKLVWEKKVAYGAGGSAANLHAADNLYPWAEACSNDAAACGTDADCGPANPCEATDPQGTGLTVFEWVAALNATGFAGHRDWRIPNVRELQSIVDHGRQVPATDPAFHDPGCGGSCTDMTSPACSCTAGSGLYWTSTTASGDPLLARMITFDHGQEGRGYKSWDGHVRAVRDGSTTCGDGSCDCGEDVPTCPADCRP